MIETMGRKRYWAHIAIIAVVAFMAGFLGELLGISQQISFSVELSLTVALWIVGYQRVKDIGWHGAWAFFAPSLIGIVVFGIPKSRS